MTWSASVARGTCLTLMPRRRKTDCSTVSAERLTQSSVTYFIQRLPYSSADDTIARQPVFQVRSQRIDISAVENLPARNLARRPRDAPADRRLKASCICCLPAPVSP